MYATVINAPSGELYSSFFSDLQEAIKYAESMPGIIRIERAHTGNPAVWVRYNKDNENH